MADKRWKRYELKAARFFGSERTPLSGINSRHDTHSDTLQWILYIETKSSAGLEAGNPYVWRAVHGLAPGIVEATGDMGLYFVHSSVLANPKRERIALHNFTPVGVFNLWREVSELAAAEDKLPLLALFTKGSRGFWIVGTVDSLLVAAREHALAEA